MANRAVDLWALDEVHFQQQGSRCRMWVPPEQPTLRRLSSFANFGFRGCEEERMTVHRQMVSIRT